MSHDSSFSFAEIKGFSVFVAQPATKNIMRSHSQGRDQSSDPMAIMFVMNIDPFDDEDKEMSESPSSSDSADDSYDNDNYYQGLSHGQSTVPVSPPPSSSQASSSVSHGADLIATSTADGHNLPGGLQLPTSSRRRPTRPPYSEEHLFFIWYARTDLGLSWRQVTGSFDDVFPGDRQQGGLQCRYYRTLKYWGVPAVRHRTAGSLQDQRTQPAPRRYGVIERTSRRYPWMFLEHQNTPCLPEFAEWSSHR